MLMLLCFFFFMYNIYDSYTYVYLTRKEQDHMNENMDF